MVYWLLTWWRCAVILFSPCSNRAGLRFGAPVGKGFYFWRSSRFFENYHLVGCQQWHKNKRQRTREMMYPPFQNYLLWQMVNFVYCKSWHFHSNIVDSLTAWIAGVKLNPVFLFSPSLASPWVILGFLSRNTMYYGITPTFNRRNCDHS